MMGSILAMVMASASPESGWVCHFVSHKRDPNSLEAILSPDGEMQKFQLKNDQLEDADPLGLEMKLHWRVITNTSAGLVAISSDANDGGPAITNKSVSGSVYADVVLIDKRTGKMVRMTTTVGGETLTLHGECVSY